MIIQCQNCSRKFQVNDEDIPKEGRMVQCSNCAQKWFQTPIKVKAPVKRKRKRVKKKIEEVEINNIQKIIDPSSQDSVSEVYEPKQGLGFFGYIFLLIIIILSAIGVLKTFEDDLINHFPEIEYIFEFLNEQLQYVSETIDIMFIIIKDVMNFY